MNLTASQKLLVTLMMVCPWHPLLTNGQFLPNIASSLTPSIYKDDPHGGVPMGVSNKICDDTKTNIEIDWNPQSSDEYTCDGNVFNPTIENATQYCTEKTEQPLHVCYPNTISYDEEPPTSGAHRPMWPDYGEYTYLPPQRWLHNLEHGAVVFLYHPCARPEEVEKMRSIATKCLRKHIITPYKKLTPDMPFAVITWGCKLSISSISSNVLVNFIKEHAKKAPEGNVAAKGQYSQALVAPAKIVFDYEDTVICPDLITKKPGSQFASGNALNSENSKLPDSSLFQDVTKDKFHQHHQQLSEEADKLYQSIQRLIRAFRKLKI